LAQSSPSAVPAVPPPPGEADLSKHLRGMSAQQLEAMVHYQTSLANRVVGIIPQALRADNPLQVINPFAPARYGSGWDNVTVDPVTGRGEGVAIFTIRF
jgi:hypothetical protein